MQKRKQLWVFFAALILALALFNMSFFGCATTSASKELTPEQKKAIQDSLFQIHKNDLARNFSFGFEPYKHGDYAKARKYFKVVAEKDTTGIYGKVLYQRLGDCFVRLNNPDSAEWAYKIGVERLPENPYFYTALGYIYRVQGRNEEAIETYENLVKLVPDSAGYHRYLGELYLKTDDPESAMEYYGTVVRLTPNDQQSQEILGQLQSQYGNIEDVIATQLSLIEGEPTNMKYRLDLARTYYQNSDFEKAIEQLRVVTEANPTDVHACEMLGDSYQQLDRYSDAANVYNTILNNDPNDKKNLCNLSMCYTSMERFPQARARANKALGIDRTYGLAHIALGMVYEATAEKCVSQRGGNVEFDDKLVYKMAYDEFTKAKSDLQWKSDAERRISYVQPLIPMREDLFMHKNQTTPRGECYQWIF